MKLPKFSGKLKKPKLPRRPLVVRKVRGTSMLPHFRPGQYVLGWTMVREIRPGDQIIFWHEGREKLKRVKQAEDNQIWVEGLNYSASTDSKDFGWVGRELVIAKVIFPRSYTSPDK